MAKIIIYTKDSCPYCRMAKDFLNTRQQSFEEIRVDLDPSKREELLKLTDKRTLPQIFINGQGVGGYDDLIALAKSGKLEELLKS